MPIVPHDSGFDQFVSFFGVRVGSHVSCLNTKERMEDIRVMESEGVSTIAHGPSGMTCMCTATRARAQCGCPPLKGDFCIDLSRRVSMKVKV